MTRTTGIDGYEVARRLRTSDGIPATPVALPGTPHRRTCNARLRRGSITASRSPPTWRSSRGSSRTRPWGRPR